MRAGMARPLRIEYPSAFYHVTARGNERKDIFKSRLDREKFLSYLESATQRYSAIIHAYCLMTNHYHLLVETPLGNLSKIMQHINSSYTSYYNVKRKRSGHLLQGRYKAILVEADSYACVLSRYIHLNPIRAGIVATPEQYPWTSYHGYVNSKDRPDWLTTKLILGYFPESQSGAAYQQFVDDLIGKEYTSPLENTFASTVLGGDNFISEIQERHISGRAAERDLPALRNLSVSVSPEDIHAAVAEALSADGQARKAAIYLCHRYSGAKLSEIGIYFRLSHSGVTQASKRFAEDIERDENLRDTVGYVRSQLNL
jgi:putative transposase